LLSGLFWNYGHHRRGIWVQYNWDSMDIPSDILVHHANFTYGQDNKIAMASRVRDRFCFLKNEQLQVSRSNGN